jgi:uncharacterized protein YndB with AHSA1/START domain
MTHYRKTLVIAARPAAVYEALTTEPGLQRWWNTGCEGAFRAGGVIDFHFGPNHKQLRVETMQPFNEVQWLCTQSHMFVGSETAHDEWTGTRMIFRLSRIEGGRTQLDFEHIGLTPALVCFDLCTEGWDYYLASLAAYAETGQGTPFVSNTMEAAA